jgi:hypothetical protein
MGMIVVNEASYYLNENDIINALRFASACEHDTVVMVVKGAKELPFLRRDLLLRLGTPSMFDKDSLYYRELGITVEMVNYEKESDLSGWSVPLNYISWDSEEDWNEVKGEYMQPFPVPYIMHDGLELMDVYNLMRRDGMNHGQVINRMNSAGLLGVEE